MVSLSFFCGEAKEGRPKPIRGALAVDANDANDANGAKTGTVVPFRQACCGLCNKPTELQNGHSPWGLQADLPWPGFLVRGSPQPADVLYGEHILQSVQPIRTLVREHNPFAIVF